MAFGNLKRGEKILFGICIFLGFFAAVSFVGMEIYRAKLEKQDKQMYPANTHYDFTEEGMRGSVLVRKAGKCTACHRVLRNGTNMGLNLDGIGSKHDFNYLYNFLKTPEATYPTKTLDHGAAPKEAAYVSQMPEADLHAIATFLSELRVDTGSADARLLRPEDTRSGFIDEMVKVWAPGTWKSEYKDIREETEKKEGAGNAGNK